MTYSTYKDLLYELENCKKEINQTRDDTDPSKIEALQKVVLKQNEILGRILAELWGQYDS